MRRPSPTIFSKLVRLMPVFVLIFGIVVAPVWGGVQKHDDAQVAKSCCTHSDAAHPSDPSSQGNDDDGCCGKACHGGICPCAKLMLLSGLSLAPTTTAIAPAIALVELSALSLSESDPIFHPPRA
jgi:hypothetical protein